MGLGQFSECGLVNCLLWLRKQINIKSPSINIFNHPVNRPHHPVWVSTESIRLRELCFVISVPVPWVCYCAITSVPDELEVCQHARGSSRCSSRCPESLDVVPLCQMAAVPVSQDCTHGSVFVCYDDIDWFLSHVMAYWLCLSPFYC